MGEDFFVKIKSLNEEISRRSGKKRFEGALFLLKRFRENLDCVKRKYSGGFQKVKFLGLS